MPSRCDDDGSWRPVRALTVIAGIGAGLYLGVTIRFRAADAAGLRMPTPLQGLFMVGAISLLPGISLASAGIGGVMVRRGAGTRGMGLLLGVLFLIPWPALMADHLDSGW